MSLIDILGPLAELQKFSFSQKPTVQVQSVPASRPPPPPPLPPPPPPEARLTAPEQRRQQQRLDAALLEPAAFKTPVYPILALVRQRDAILSTGKVLAVHDYSTHVCYSDCTHITHPNEPCISICAESGLLHKCSAGCKLARLSPTDACPISGIHWPALRRIEEPDAKYDDRYSLARHDEHDPIGQILKSVRAKQPIPDEAETWKRMREASVAERVREIVRDLVFSEHRRQYDAERLLQARKKLAKALLASMRSSADTGRYGISLLHVKQQAENVMMTLERGGPCLTGSPTEEAESEIGILQFSDECAAKWVELENLYGGGEKGEQQQQHDDKAAEKPIAQRASRRPQKLVIDNMECSFRSYVVASLYHATPPQELKAILPSESYLATRFALRSFKLHKAFLRYITSRACFP